MSQVPARRVRIQEFLQPEDICLALKEAGMTIMPGRRKEVRELATRASELAWRVISGQVLPSIPAIRRIASEISGTEKAAIAFQRKLIRGLPRPTAPDADWGATLAHQISASDDPVHLNLLEAMALVPAASQPAQVLADLICDALCFCTASRGEWCAT